MIYFDEDLNWVTTQDPVNADDIHKMLQEGIAKMEKPPNKIIMCPEVYHILKLRFIPLWASKRYCTFEAHKMGHTTYMGIPIEVKDLPDGQLALLIRE